MTESNLAAPPPLAPPPPRNDYAYPPPRPSFTPRSNNKGKGCLGILLGIFIGLLIGGIIGCYAVKGTISAAMESVVRDVGSGGRSSSSVASKVLCDGDPDKIIGVVRIDGVITHEKLTKGACSETICELLDTLMETEDSLKAIVLDMNTPGGEIIASEDIWRKVREINERIPVITFMRDMGTSGGYYIAAGSRWIVARPTTFTANIGVIMSGLNATGLADKIGIAPKVYKSGAMKDMMSPLRPATPEEDRHLQALIQESFHQFADVVAQGRPQFQTAEDVMNAEFGDGRVLSGRQAKEAGLVDELGTFEDAVAAAEREAGIHDAQVVRFGRKMSWLDSLMEMKFSQRTAIEGLIPIDGVHVEAGKPYYLWSGSIAR